MVETIVFVLPFLLMSALVTITGVAALLNHHLPSIPGQQYLPFKESSSESHYFCRKRELNRDCLVGWDDHCGQSTHLKHIPSVQETSHVCC